MGGEARVLADMYAKNVIFFDSSPKDLKTFILVSS